jgi:AraC-like DNA-binding protein
MNEGPQHPFVSPQRARRLPPKLVAAAANDPLRNDGEDHSRKVKACHRGVRAPLEHVHVGIPRQLPNVVADLFKAVSKTLEHERESAAEYIEKATAILTMHLLRAISDAPSQISPCDEIATSGESHLPKSRTTTKPLDLHNVQDSLDEIYANAVSIATTTRLICINARSMETSRNGLQKWRLKRVIDHVDTYLADPITLENMSKVAGLTRMHFARQFRVATGVRPHEYVVRRRIERAKELLRNSGISLVEVALGVGFQTQPHFTTVFKRFVGQTPHRWRASITGLPIGTNPKDGFRIAPVTQ